MIAISCDFIFYQRVEYALSNDIDILPRLFAGEIDMSKLKWYRRCSKCTPCFWWKKSTIKGSADKQATIWSLSFVAVMLECPSIPASKVFLWNYRMFRIALPTKGITISSYGRTGDPESVLVNTKRVQIAQIMCHARDCM